MVAWLWTTNYHVRVINSFQEGLVLPMPHAFPFDSEQFRTETVVVGDHVTITLETTAPSRPCPLCGHTAARIHSRYMRRLADLPAYGARVVLHLRCRRFFCRNAGCQRRIFAERLTGFAQVGARQTQRRRAILRLIGLALGGEGGARLADRLEMPSSPDTLLRLVRAAPTPKVVPPRVVGVDDWAKRKGSSYAAIVCDLERHRVIDLLPDRTAPTFAAWLKERPGIEVISRDRAGSFAEGATQGAPDALQVADRWHLLHNLGDAVEEYLKRQHRHLPQATTPLLESPSAPLAQPKPERRPRTDRSKRERGPLASRARRLQRYEAILELYQRGMSMHAIERQYGISRDTVSQWVRAGSFPERAPRVKQPSMLDPFRPYLEQRWAEGCRNGRILLAELHAQGFRGGHTLVATAIAELRRYPPRPEATLPATPVVAPVVVPSSPAAPRKVRWWFVRSPSDLTIDEHRSLEEFFSRCAEAKVVYGLAQRFGRLVRDHRAEDLAPWLADAQSGPREMRSFANGIQRDRAAVDAALTTQWSNGQTEGQIHRLKLIKRSMYGRAKFDLLRQRVLEAA
jgi:transposase